MVKVQICDVFCHHQYLTISQLPVENPWEYSYLPLQPISLLEWPLGTLIWPVYHHQHHIFNVIHNSFHILHPQPVHLLNSLWFDVIMCVRISRHKFIEFLLASLGTQNLPHNNFFKHNFCSSHMYPENPEGTQVIVSSMNMGYISDTARNRTHNLFCPKPIPLGHHDGQNWHQIPSSRSLYFIQIHCIIILTLLF